MQATTSIAAPPPAARPTAARSTDRSQLPQYSLRQILAIWAAAALPMGLLAWIVAPWLRDQLGGRDPFIEALLICFTAGLLWMLALVLILLRRELGGLAWPRVRDALWLRAPRDPKTARVGGKVWLWALPFVVLSAAVNALPIDPVGPMPRDLPKLIDTDRAEHFFSRQLGLVRDAGGGCPPGSGGRGAALPGPAPAAHASVPSGSAISSPTARSSRSTTCTSRGACRPR